MIRNIKIYNILDIIELLKCMEPNKFISKEFMKMFFKVFPMIFQSSMG